MFSDGWNSPVPGLSGAWSPTAFARPPAPAPVAFAGSTERCARKPASDHLHESGCRSQHQPRGWLDLGDLPTGTRKRSECVFVGRRRRGRHSWSRSWRCKRFPFGLRGRTEPDEKVGRPGPGCQGRIQSYRTSGGTKTEVEGLSSSHRLAVQMFWCLSKRSPSREDAVRCSCGGDEGRMFHAQRLMDPKTATCWFGPVHPGCEGQNPSERVGLKH